MEIINQYFIYLKVFCIDNALEFTQMNLRSYCESLGIIHQTSCHIHLSRMVSPNVNIDIFLLSFGPLCLRCMFPSTYGRMQFLQLPISSTVCCLPHLKGRFHFDGFILMLIFFLLLHGCLVVWPLFRI